MPKIYLAGLSIFMILFGLVITVMTPHSLLSLELQRGMGIMLMLGGIGVFYIACNSPYKPDKDRNMLMKFHERLKDTVNSSAMHAAAFDICGVLLIFMSFLGGVVMMFQGYYPWFLVFIPIGGYALILPRL